MRAVGVNHRPGSFATATRDTAIALSVRVAGGVLLLTWEVLVARRSGPEAAGRFFLAFTIVATAATLGRFGLDVVAYREAAISAPAHSSEAATRLGSARGLALRLLTGTAVCVGVLSLLFGGSVFGDPLITPTLAVAALSILPLGMLVIEGEALKGSGRIGIASLCQSVIGPLTAIIALAVVPEPTSPILALIFAGGIASAATAAWAIRVPSGGSASASGDPGSIMRLGAPFAVNAVANLAIGWAGVVAVGIVRGPDSVTSIFLADRVTSVGVMVVVAANAAVGSAMARAGSRGDLSEADRVRRGTQKVLTVLAIGYLVVIMLGGPLIGRAVGPRTDDFVTLLVVLGIGQAVVMAGGPSTMFLLMCGGQQFVARISVATLAVAIALQALAVSRWGVIGSAWAITLSWIGNRLLLWRAVAATLRTRSD